MIVAIRGETPADVAAVRHVHERAFGGSAEADIVDALRAAGAVTLALVAETAGLVIGHLLFSPITVDGVTRGVGLAPLGVLPEHQRHGVGGALTQTGLKKLEAAGETGCVVLGHPAYYPRFGFQPAARFGLRWEHGHDDAFFALELVAGSFAGGGVVRYRPELA